ncbi:hypothetical protein GECvBGOT_gp204c [Salmonella phage GEC_vB_GOT]|nr:hypothetical protein GECvBGOT_gp204c [Salmonella phage GEC_vB_GOT]
MVFIFDTHQIEFFPNICNRQITFRMQFNNSRFLRM